MYINFWYPVAASNAVTNEAPFRTRILGHDFVAFRHTDGTAHVLADTCIHRGAALGEGKIIDNCVQCPYHGWRYNTAGECVLIPPLPQEKPPSRAKVDSYPTQERYGILFAFLGDLQEDQRLRDLQGELHQLQQLLLTELVRFEGTLRTWLEPAPSTSCRCTSPRCTTS